MFQKGFHHEDKVYLGEILHFSLFWVSVMLTEEEIRKAYEKAREWFKKNFAPLAAYVDEPSLEVVETNDGWDIRAFVAERKIKVNFKRVRWHLEREEKVKHCPKYDIETALIHDIFEYCYLRRWDYPENDSAVNVIVHSKAKVLENRIRQEKGLTPWI